MTDTSDSTSIRRLAAADAAALLALRREALEAAPEAFSASPEDEAGETPETLATRLAAPGASAVFGAFDGPALVGMAGFAAQQRLKERHKGTMWGVYLRAGARGRGLAEALVRAVIAHAKGHVRLLQAGVGVSNTPARRTYHRLGFVPYGVEAKALRVGGRYIDEELLVLDFGAEPAASTGVGS